MITGINHITLAVWDVGRSFDFYTRVLGLQPVMNSLDAAYLTAGDLWIALVRDDRVRSGPLPEYTHLAFSVPPDDFARVQSELESAGVEKWQENRTEGDSFYFLDPDGHKLEVHGSDLETRVRTLKRMTGGEREWFV
ncbi:MAG: VOC family protein [Proteobacteria bacterium]|nr:VOC family protein [Pseudomonadota bacterium]